MAQEFGLNAADWLAALWLVSVWMGYSLFARRRARTSFCIASALHYHRQQWMLAMLMRNNHITDASLLTSLERNASFLASTAILVIAGLVTTLASLEKVYIMLAQVPFARTDLSPLKLQFKLLALLVIHVYSFFTFTWSMRQYGFCAVLVGAAPERPAAAEAQRYARNAAKVIDRAGHSYNAGLRAYYFSLAILAWLISNWLFMIAVAAVVGVLYGREFHSKTLKALVQVGNLTEADLPKRRAARAMPVDPPR